MKLWLDDIRTPPDNTWVWVTNADDFKMIVRNLWQAIDVISMDHDLGLNDDSPEISGYTLLCWIEDTGLWPCHIRVHSMNPVGAAKMRAVIEAHERQTETQKDCSSCEGCPFCPCGEETEEK